MASELELTVRISKTKFLVVWYGVKEEELLPVAVNEGSIKCVFKFPCLQLLIAARIDIEEDK